MLIGIDVGGTFTDAVLIEGQHILASGKCRTTHGHLMDGILAALDTIMPAVSVSQVERITLSTTVVTNTVVEGKEAPVDLYIVPGPGMNLEGTFPVEPIVLQGYTDHRGQIVESIHSRHLEQILSSMDDNHTLAAVSTKFGVRNPKEEQIIGALLDSKYDYVSQGASLSGTLNFPRRTISAYFNSAVYPAFADFKESVVGALAERGLTAPLYILKADGGSLPIKAIAKKPVETTFTGPAATVLGLSALSHIDDSMIVALDIGGTTTDISLWRQGKPLMTKHGVKIRDYPSAVRAFAVHSVGIGGESAVSIVNGALRVGPERKGPSVALGGKIPTLGDALIELGYAHYGDEKAAHDAMDQLGLVLELDAHKVAQEILTMAIDTIIDGIYQIVEQENKQPIYVVADMMHPHLFVPEALVVVGGTAQALGPLVGKMMKLPVTIPKSAPVANAIGAAVSLSSIELTVHVDTKHRKCIIPELGRVEYTSTLRTSKEAIDLGFSCLQKEAERLGLGREYEGKIPCEVVSVEDFPVIEGWQSMERLITVKVQLKAGVRTHVQ